MRDHESRLTRLFRKNDAGAGRETALVVVMALLGLSLYGYVLAVLLLTRQEWPLVFAAACGVLVFAATAVALWKRGRRIAAAPHGLAAAASFILVIIVVMIM